MVKSQNKVNKVFVTVHISYATLCLKRNAVQMKLNETRGSRALKKKKKKATAEKPLFIDHVF